MREKVIIWGIKVKIFEIKKYHYKIKVRKRDKKPKFIVKKLSFEISLNFEIMMSILWGKHLEF